MTARGETGRRGFSLAGPAPAPPDAGPAIPPPMLDLRLVPAALLTWAATALTLAAPTPVGGLLLAAAVCAGALAWRRGAPTVALPAAVAAIAVAGTLLRRGQAAAHPIAGHVGSTTSTRLTLASTPKATDHGATAEATIAGLPGRVRVFGDDRLLGHDRGTVLDAVARIGDSDRPSLSGIVAGVRGTVDVVKHPDGHVTRVRDGLRDAAAGLPAGPDRMVPAMTLGDERAFTAADAEMMADSGLAHLSAVSGANVALVTGAAVWAMSWAPPRWRAGAAAVAMAAFVAVVGTEPSVLRALVTGGVGVLAVVLGRRGQAVPALMSGVIVLLVAFPDLSVSVGFALSVSATAALVLAAVPVTRRLLLVPGVARLPAPLVRAAAVALTAHVATVPVLAATISDVSHVSVPANLAAAPAVGPVTILGTLAAVAALLGLGPVTDGLVHAAAPFAWWVYAVGHAAASVPGASGAMGVAGLAVFAAVAVAALAWPQVAAGIAVVALSAAGIVVAAGRHVPEAPPGWVLAACDDGGRVRVISPARDDAHLRDLPRPCRLALRSPPAGGAGGGAETGAGTGDGAPAGPERTVLPTLDDAEGAVGAVGVPGATDVTGATGASGAAPRWLVVADCGDRARRRISTAGGVPVVCPARDGPQALYPGGGIWSAGGKGAAGGSGESGTMGE